MWQPKQNTPFEVYKWDFLGKMHQKKSSYFEGKNVRSLPYLENEFWEVEVTRTMQDFLQHFYFPVCPLGMGLLGLLKWHNAL
jgi:hypothetical protein